MKRLETCCCCGSLKAGTIITSVLGIIMSILTIVIIWLRRDIVFSTILFDSLLEGTEIPRIVLTVNLCMTILICTLLIIGVLMRRSWLMLPWVVLGIILAIGTLISVLYTSISLYLDDKEDRSIIATIILVCGIIFVLIFLYLWTVVLSHYMNVRDEEERGRYMKAPYRR